MTIDLNKCLLASALVAASLFSAPAEAGTRFALTCIGTDTGYDIHYQYRWGSSEEWQDATVEPGDWRLHTYNYDYEGENRSPQFEIRYDDDAGNGSNIVRTKLDSFAASRKDCEDEGKTYNFYERSGELFIGESD